MSLTIFNLTIRTLRDLIESGAVGAFSLLGLRLSVRDCARSRVLNPPYAAVIEKLAHLWSRPKGLALVAVELHEQLEVMVVEKHVLAIAIAWPGRAAGRIGERCRGASPCGSFQYLVGGYAYDRWQSPGSDSTLKRTKPLGGGLPEVSRIAKAFSGALCSTAPGVEKLT